MNKTRLTASLASLLSAAISINTYADAKDLFFEPNDTALSYVYGMELGKTFQHIDSELNIEAFIKGLETSSKGTKPLLTAKQISLTMEYLEKKSNLKNGQLYLKQNAKKPGVLTTSSGIQFDILQEGSGPKPKVTDTITVHYTGTLINGSLFDSSYDRNEPATFRLTDVIDGWKEILQLMPVGSKWNVVIPPHMAYGEKSSGSEIGPNSTLIFEINLLKIVK